MRVTVKEVCDACLRDLPVLGGRNASGDTSVHRVKRTHWKFFSRLLAWQPERESWEVLCGDCWQEFVKAIRAKAAAASSSRPGKEPAE